jgi:hypothetical protein
VTEMIVEAMTAPTVDGQPSLPRRAGPKGLLPSTWLERAALEEREELDRAHGEFILDIATGARKRREQGADPLFEALRRAHQAEAEEADKQ